jgi:hypothetical protein
MDSVDRLHTRSDDATPNIDAMCDFYVGCSVLSAQNAGLEFTLVAAVAMKAKIGKNLTHYDLFIPDLEAGLALVETHGDTTNGKIGEDKHERAIGIYDPDGNFMEFKQCKQAK